VAAALASVRLPGRFEPIGVKPRTWRDGAHTPRSLRAAVAATADESGLPPVVVLALKRDKPLAACLRAVRGRCGPVVATALPDGACHSPEEIVAAARRIGIMARPCADPAAAVARARRLAGRGGAVLVAGSFWLAGAVARRWN
jgi:dihydrofolate synthase/folylpolyglutamate synthase